MRLFVAVDVPDAVKVAIETQVGEPLRRAVEGARWTRPESRHLTLKFLGEVSDERVDEVSAAARGAVSSHAPFEAAFSELGGFPTLRRPRVLWVGIGEGADAIAAIASDLERALEPLGFAPEGRSFTAHLTLARFQRPKIIEALPEVRVPTERFAVTDVVLFRSQLHPKGARYSVVERFPLLA